MADLHSLSFAELSQGRLAPLLAGTAADGPTTVWPFCDDYENARRIPDLLPPACELATVNPALNRAAAELAEFMVNIDECVWPGSAPRGLWSASDISDRGPNAGGLALNIARRRILMQAAMNGGRHIVVTDDRSLGAALIGAGPVDTGRLSFLAGAALRRIKGAIRHAQRIAAAKAIASTFDRRLAALREADVLLTVWAGPQSFTGSTPADWRTNMGDLPRILSDAGVKVGFLALPLYWLYPLAEINRNAAASGAPVLMIDELLSPKDVLVNLCHGMSLPSRLRFPLIHDGMDFSHVLWREALLATRSERAPANHLFRLAGPRLAALGLRPTATCYAYEFQPWERGLVAGMKDALPGTRTVAIQVAPFAENYLSLLPSRQDMDSPCMPDLLIALGRVSKNTFCRWGVPENRLAVGGALRFDGLAFQSAERGAGGRTEATAPAGTVLCCLGMEFGPAVELASKAIEAVSPLPDRRLTINFHPLEDTARVKRSLRAIVGDAAMERVNFSTAGVRELAAGADVVLYNTSGAAIEALWSGTPVIFVGQDGHIDHDKLPDGAARKCKTVDEIVTAITASGGARRDVALETMLDGYILPVDKDVFIAAMRS